MGELLDTTVCTSACRKPWPIPDPEKIWPISFNIGDSPEFFEMTNPSSQLTSERFQTWFEELAVHVPGLGLLFKATEREQLQRGYYHTLREICQQPLTWTDTASRLNHSRDKLRSVLKASGVQEKHGSILLIGSGSSLFVAECLNLSLQRSLSVPVQAVSAGLVLTHPELVLPPGQDCLLVSFGRSGDSPESVAAINVLHEMNGSHRHLIITCNQDGKLATRYLGDPRFVSIVLDDATCDRSLVMTSSFTNMVWAGRALGMLSSPEEYVAQTSLVSRLAKEIFLRHAESIAETGQGSFRSVVYLGSGVRFGAARESALKMIEMTGGQVTSFAETYLGVRHGPLSAILSDTLIACFLSSDPLVRAYELDLIRELNDKKLGICKLIVGENIPEDVLLTGDLAIECPGLGELGDEGAPILDAIVGQLLAFFRCLSLGLQPDSPSSQGIISRVVGQFAIHRKA